MKFSFSALSLFITLLMAAPISTHAATESDACTPLIGVSGQSRGSRTVVPLISVLKTLGAETIYLGPQGERDPNIDIPKLDGLVLGGNNEDINPARYGAELDERTQLESSPERGDYEYAAIELALENDLPLLGICGGMQRMAVSGDEAVRGSLIQHVDGQNQGKYDIPLPPYIPTDTLSVETNTMLADILNRDDHSMKVNSYHHQVPDKLREGFIVSARSEKHGTIEAMEVDPDGAYAGQYAIGVMWHPEFSGDALSRDLMKSFVEAAKERACSQPEESAEADVEQ